MALPAQAQDRWGRCKNPVVSREGLIAPAVHAKMPNSRLTKDASVLPQIASIHGANWPFLKLASEEMVEFSASGRAGATGDESGAGALR